MLVCVTNYMLATQNQNHVMKRRVPPSHLRLSFTANIPKENEAGALRSDLISAINVADRTKMAVIVMFGCVPRLFCSQLVKICSSPSGTPLLAPPTLSYTTAHHGCRLSSL